MSGTVSTAVCNELREEYEKVALEDIFLFFEKLEKGMEPFELKDTIFADADTSRFVDFRGMPKSEYQEEIDQSLNRFIEDCIDYGILERTFGGRLKLVMADPNLLEFERPGIRIEFNRVHPYTVYRKRMNTSGRIDVKANGDPAIDGVTSQDPLAY